MPMGQVGLDTMKYIPMHKSFVNTQIHSIINSKSGNGFGFGPFFIGNPRIALFGHCFI